MSSERVRIRLQDIVDNADWVAEYLEGYDLEAFKRDRRTADAVERCFGRITEAVIQLGPLNSEQAGLAVPWSEVRSLGNRLRHEYRRIDRTIIYTIARDDLPPLRNAAARALEAL